MPFMALPVSCCFKAVKVVSSVVTFESRSDEFWGWEGSTMHRSFALS